MSMHFAPQWVKPMKTTAALNSGDAAPQSTRQTHQSTPSHPFPALNPGRASPSIVPAPSNPAMSYSKITNAQSPQSPSFPADNAAQAQEQNGNTRPFRYSRDFIIGLWDEVKVKEVPIELAELMEHGGVLVSKEVVKPIGMRDLSEVEKKLLATSVHPTNPARQRMATNDRPDRVDRNDREQANGHVIRRPIPPPTNGKDMSAAPGSGRGVFGGFGRGEGGAFGGGKIGTIGSGPLSAGLETRGPGTMGGGFGGVPKRLGRRTESTDLGSDAPAPRVAAPWRTTRTTSGTFEGVLGFGQTPSAPANAASEAIGGVAPGWRERQEKERLDKERLEREKIEEAPEPTYGKGGGPGWGNGQKKWRMAAGVDSDKGLEMPTPSMAMSDSVVATASATPVPERDATVRDVTVPQSNTPAPQSEAQEKEDLGSVLWFYRDPAGDEQGSFTGTQMHDWYSHAYFTDDLPLRRKHETGFHTLSELKAATGNSVQPFLSPVRPRLPPNLPIPSSAIPMSSPGINGPPADAFRNLNINPIPQAAYNQYMPDRTPFSGNQYGQFGQQQQIQSPGFGSPAAAAPWGGLPPRGPVDNFGIRSPFGGDQFIGAGGPQPYSPAPGAPVYAQQPYGVPPPNPNPWGVPGGMAQPGLSAQMPMYNQAPGQPILSPMPEQYHPQSIQQQQPQQQPQQQQQQQFQPEPSPREVVLDEPSYFPPVEAEAEAEPQQSVEEAAYEAAKKQFQSPQLSQPSPSPAPATVEPEVPTPADKTPSAPPTSVWGQVTPRKQSIAEAAPVSIPAPTAAAKQLPPAPSSLPPKPIAIPSQVTDTVSKPSPATPSTQPTSKPAPAPWAAKEDRPSTPTGPSLRDIQDSEAKAADLRRAALSEARASAQTPTSSTADADVPSNMSWGLPSSGSGKNANNAPGPASPATPVPAWGSGDAGPKKTLKQIQEEEERRKKAVQAAAMAKAVAAGGAGGVSSKRGYADLAANAAAPSAPPAGWSTVGLGGKVIPGAAPKTGVATPTKPTLTPLSTTPKPSIISTPTKKSNGSTTSNDDLQPASGDFLKWVKSALTGLKTPADDFIQMLLTFPIDPPASSRSEMLEIISDSVYANSSTLDGRRFALEFYEKRKVDAKRVGGGGSGKVSGGGGGGYSLADVVKSAPAKKEDVGFKIVKAKGKKKN